MSHSELYLPPRTCFQRDADQPLPRLPCLSFVRQPSVIIGGRGENRTPDIQVMGLVPFHLATLLKKENARYFYTATGFTGYLSISRARSTEDFPSLLTVSLPSEEHSY
jgi:hypothetical protein